MDDLDYGATVRGFSPGQKIFGRYLLREQLGRGGMGVVWQAWDESLEQEVAIKMLPELVAHDPASVRELKRETSRNQGLSHPHILRVFDFVEAGHLCGITMELASGGTLSAKRLEQPQLHFEAAQLREWIRQLCDALAHAHDRARVVHRDLKPANLMLSVAGELKVTDFGIAASLSDSITRISRHASSSGTPVYMSPQQMMGEKPAVTDDIYSLGATLYELLTGKPPFYSGNVVIQVQAKVPPSMIERRRELEVSGDAIPAEWEETVAACLAKDPAHRPRSAREVASRLGLSIDSVPHPSPEKIAPAASEPLSATPTEPARRAERRFPRGWMLAVTGALFAAAGAWYFLGHLPAREAAAAAERAETARAAEATRQAALAAQQRRDAEEAEKQRREVEAARLAAARGGVIIRTEPSGAEVRVGAVALDRSPLTVRGLKLGKYPVRVRLTGYDDYNTEVEITENEFADPGLIHLVRQTGRLELVATPPGVRYRLASPGTPVATALLEGQTPAADLTVPTGTYDVIFERPGWGEHTQTVTIAPGEAALVSADLRGGSAAITTEPSGAAIYRGDELLGTAPIVLSDLPWKVPTTLTARLPLHASATSDVTPTPGQTQDLKITLVRLHTRLKLVGLPAENRGQLHVRWGDQELALNGDGTIEIPGGMTNGRLRVEYGPVTWERDLTVRPGETADVRPDLIPRLDLSRAPRLTRTRNESSFTSGSMSMRNTETQEIEWRRRDGNRWTECEARMLETTSSSRLVGSNIYHPGTAYRFIRTGSTWRVETVRGGLKAMPSMKPSMPHSGAWLLTEDLLPSRPVLIGEWWELSPSGVATFAGGLLRSTTGQVRGQVAEVVTEAGRRVTVLIYECDVAGQAMYLDAQQSIRGTLVLRAVLDEGWVKEAMFRSDTMTTGVGRASTVVTITEQPAG